MSGLGLLGTLFVGILAGWIAEKALNRNHGLITNLIVGLIGSFIGSAIAGALHLSVAPGIIGSLIVSAVGAIVLLFLLGLFKR